MSASKPVSPSLNDENASVDPALERRLERLGLADHQDQWTERYLLCEHLVDPPLAESRQQFEATSRFIRDLVAHRWAKTRQAREQAHRSAFTTCRWSSCSAGRSATT